MITLPVLLLALAASALANDNWSQSKREENDYKSQHRKSMDEHYKHLITLLEFPCIHPQPRVIPVRDLLSTYPTRGLAFYPEYTVLYRCDVSTGCCKDGGKCGPVHAHMVKLPFKVIYLEKMGDKQEVAWEFEYYRFENHTACSCLDNQGNHDQGLPIQNLDPRMSPGHTPYATDTGKIQGSYGQQYAGADNPATGGTGSVTGTGTGSGSAYPRPSLVQGRTGVNLAPPH